MSGTGGASDDWSEADWRLLAERRDGYLAGRPRPWRGRRDLELYDATFARRIAWKWEYVLAQAAAAG